MRWREIPYIWELLIRRICLPHLPAVAVSALWYHRYAPSALLDFSLCSFFPTKQAYLSCSLSPLLSCQVLDHSRKMRLALDYNLKYQPKRLYFFFCLKREWWTICMWGSEFWLFYVRVCGAFPSLFCLCRKLYSCCLSIFSCLYTDFRWMTLEA